MTYLGGVLIVLGAATFAAALTYAGRRFIPLAVRKSHHEVGSAVFLQLGVIFAVLLAFVFNQVWSEYNVAAQSINGECGTLRTAAMLADTLPPAQARPVEQAIASYVRDVIEDEWPAMARQRRSAITIGDMAAMWREVTWIDATTRLTAAIQGQLFSLLAQAQRQRETRLFEMTQALPTIVWCLLVLFSVGLVAFLTLSGVDYILSQAGFAALLAGFLAFILVIIRLLDFPFQGALGLQPADFHQTLQQVLQLAGVA